MSYTFEEFEAIDSWWELLDFCEFYNVSCGYDRDYIYTADSLAECIMDKARSYDWESIYDIVRDISDFTGDDDDYYDWSSSCPTLLSDDDFWNAKTDALESLHYEDIYLEGEDREEDEDEDEESPTEGYAETIPIHAVRITPPKAASMYGRVDIDDGVLELESDGDFNPDTFNKMIGG